jgi:hypothetical protein
MLEPARKLIPLRLSSDMLPFRSPDKAEPVRLEADPRGDLSHPGRGSRRISSHCPGQPCPP